MVKLSLIIPIYKVEKYIVECLESVCCQLVEGVEVILVNDGTPDRSMEMAKDYINNKYYHHLSRFIFIDQENQGQSVARNVALKKAVGDYIAFLDSDDVIVENYLETLLPLLNGIDVIQFKSARFSDNTSDLTNFNVGVIKEQGVYENSRKLMVDVFNQSAWFPWLNVYKNDLFKDVEFPSGVYYEDAAIIPEIFLKAKKIYFLDKVLYLYRVNLNSSLLNITEVNLKKHIKSFEYIIKLYREKLKEEEIYSPSFVALNQGYVSFLYKHFGLKKTRAANDFFKKNKNLVNSKILNKKGNILYYKFGMLFIFIMKCLGRI